VNTREIATLFSIVHLSWDKGYNRRLMEGTQHGTNLNSNTDATTLHFAHVSTTSK